MLPSKAPFSLKTYLFQADKYGILFLGIFDFGEFVIHKKESLSLKKKED